MADLFIHCPGASDTGAYRIEWQGPEAIVYRLIETDPSGADHTLYEGSELASTVSGRMEGPHTYRVGVLQAGGTRQWSDPCIVDVQPPSMGLALLLFAVGLLVCLATVAVIVRGHRAHRRGAIG